VRAGTEDASFEAWYVVEHPRLVAAMTIAAANPDVGREVAAEAFARAYERWDRVALMEAPAAWTYRVAVNLLKRRWRRAAVDEAYARRLPALPVAEADTSVEVWTLVASLAPRARTIVALRYLGGMTEREVAAAVGVAPGTVAATLHKARARLAEMLADTGAAEADTDGVPHG
jgi:RNA polymerase sigma-70 factor (ECF subfamily)